MSPPRRLAEWTSAFARRMPRLHGAVQSTAGCRSVLSGPSKGWRHRGTLAFPVMPGGVQFFLNDQLDSVANPLADLALDGIRAEAPASIPTRFPAIALHGVILRPPRGGRAVLGLRNWPDDDAFFAFPPYSGNYQHWPFVVQSIPPGQAVHTVPVGQQYSPQSTG